MLVSFASHEANEAQRFRVPPSVRDRAKIQKEFTCGELANEAWVLSPQDSALGTAEAFRAIEVAYLRVSVVTIPPEMRMSLLTTGRFLTILPASGLRFPTQRPDLKLLPVKLRVARVTNGTVTLKNRTLNPTARLFIEQAREVARPFAKKTS